VFDIQGLCRFHVDLLLRDAPAVHGVEFDGGVQGNKVGIRVSRLCLLLLLFAVSIHQLANI
jgi:hypothetical protein